MAGLGASLFSVVVGLPILRLKGQYFLMATMGLLELLREIITNLSFTGGGQGITLPMFPGGAATANHYFYYLMFGLMIVSILCTFYISRSSLGYAFRAIRFDEEAASVMGINPTMYKTSAWALSAFFTGMAGGAYAYWMSYIDPGEAFQMTPSIKMYLMMVLGGRGTVLGPIIGAFFIEMHFRGCLGRIPGIALPDPGPHSGFRCYLCAERADGLFEKGFTLSKLIAGVKENKV